MKYHSQAVAVLSIISITWAQFSLAGEEVDQSLAAAADGVVKISNTRGAVKVVGWDENRVSVTGELDDLLEEFIFEADGDTTLVEVKIPRRNVSWGSGSDLVIHVPGASRVNFDGVSSDIEVLNVSGGLRAATASGDIDATGIGTEITVKTVSGDVDIADSSGQANISSVSGDIKLEVMSDRLMLDTVSGDVEATLKEISRLVANAVSGAVEVEGNLLADGEIDITGVSGDIQVMLTEPVNARVSVETGPGGDVTNRLSDHAVESRFPARKVLDASVGEGKGDIQIRTVSGDVELGSVD